MYIYLVSPSIILSELVPRPLITLSAAPFTVPQMIRCVHATASMSYFCNHSSIVSINGQIFSSISSLLNQKNYIKSVCTFLIVKFSLKNNCFFIVVAIIFRFIFPILLYTRNKIICRYTHIHTNNIFCRREIQAISPLIRFICRIDGNLVREA